MMLLVGACSPTRGCVEANFRLADDSRLPKWFASAGIPRASARVTMDYYIGPVGRTATFTLRNQDGGTVDSVIGTLQGDHPLSLDPSGPTGATKYPSFEIITANGLTEVIEHRYMNDIFYVVDDPEIKRKLGVRP